MKDCTKQLLLFKGISNKKIEADFNGGEVSSDAGVLFLREVENRIGLISKMTDSLRDRRHPGYVKHQLLELFKQRVFQIACGYEDGNDSNELREDPIMKIACERLPDEEELASQPTISRFENGISRTDLYRIAEVFVDVFIQSYSEPPEGIILDIDDTDDLTYGHQHKNHLFSDRTSCTSFSANQFRLFLHSAAYVLLHTFRALHLKGTEWASAQFDTIRLKIIKIGARIIQRTRKIRIHLPTSFPWKGELQKIWLSCCGAGHT